MPSQMNLLLAEDDAILADALSAQLRRAGFVVEHAPNGAVAEYLLLKQNFNVAILDLGLPMVDGLTVLKRLRAARRQLPVLVLTALDSLDDRVAGLNAGADDYLTKPFDFPELEARLHALMPYKAPPDLSKFLLSPMPGLLVDVVVQEGQKVQAGEKLAVIEAMKMENVLLAAQDGVVGKLVAGKGESLSVDQVILEFV